MGFSTKEVVKELYALAPLGLRLAFVYWVGSCPNSPSLVVVARSRLWIRLLWSSAVE
jgi:hypothetical protein